MSKKILAFILCAAALVCFVLPFISTELMSISGFSAVFGYSFMGYDILAAQLLPMLALLCGIAALVLAFTRADILCPLLSFGAAVLLILFRILTVGALQAELSTLFSAGAVGGGMGLWAAVVLFAAAGVVRLYKGKKAAEVANSDGE